MHGTALMPPFEPCVFFCRYRVASKIMFPTRYAWKFDTVAPSPFVVLQFSRGFCNRPVRAFYVRSVDGFKVWRLDMRRGAVEG